MKKTLTIAAVSLALISQSVLAFNFVNYADQVDLRYRIGVQKAQIQKTSQELNLVLQQIAEQKKRVEFSTNYLATSSFMVGAGIMALIITNKFIDGGTYGMGKLVPGVISLTVAGLGVIGTAGSGYALVIANKDLNTAYSTLRLLRNQLDQEYLKLLILEDSLETPI